MPLYKVSWRVLGKLLHVCLVSLPTPPQSEELQNVRGFLERNQDLLESLRPQWQRLEEVQALQGEQIDTLTGRVDDLEKNTAGVTAAGTGKDLGKSLGKIG